MPTKKGRINSSFRLIYRSCIHPPHFSIQQCAIACRGKQCCSGYKLIKQIVQIDRALFGFLDKAFAVLNRLILCRHRIVPIV